MGYLETLLTSAGIYIIYALSLYIIISTGQLSVGQAGFFAIGAYTTSIFCMIFEMHFIPSIIVGGVVSGFIGFWVSIPLLRLTHFYYAIATLAFGEMVRVFCLNFQLMVNKRGVMIGPEGPLGFRQITYLTNHGITRTDFFLIVCGFVFLICLFFFALRKSALGSVFKAVQEDDIKAGTLGINAGIVKISAFTLGAILAGIAGGLFALFMTVIRADFFGFELSFFALIACVLGGMETFYGSIVGVLALTFLPEFVRFLKEYRMMVYSVILVVIIVYSPRGLIHEDLLEKIKLFFKKKQEKSK